MKDALALLSFDLEEFDIPGEFRRALPGPEQVAVTLVGLQRLTALLADRKIVSTFFSTAVLAMNAREAVRELGQTHEIASHGYAHTGFSASDPDRSKKVLEEITKKPVFGYRSPRFRPVADHLLRKAGYTYNSSENPTFLPGRYCRLFSPRKAYRKGDLIRIPVSVSPLIRFPCFWLAFKNTPPALFRTVAAWTLAEGGYLHLVFHPWEFADLDGYGLPRWISSPCGQELLDRLASFLDWLGARARFTTLADFSVAFLAQ
ncbi:MAG: polysaccharide deacetylase family protein [Methylacidiphilaceae bacterium]|nr:polysaccharide deacetylase family protein [Candidatus Methylacidiphilaceae bacterium]